MKTRLFVLSSLIIASIVIMSGGMRVSATDAPPSPSAVPSLGSDSSQITTSAEPRNEWADKIVRSANGHLWVIVRQDGGGTWQNNLYRSTDQGATWSLVGSAGQFAQYSESTISIDSRDRIHIAWIGNPSTLNDVWYNYYDIPSGQWQGATALATGSLHQAPGHILVTSTDELYLFWFTATSTRVNFRRSTDRGVTWGSEQATPDFGTDVGSYHIRTVADSTGKIHLIVGSERGSKTVGYIRFDGTTWSNWMQLSGTWSVAEGANIAVDSGDALYVVWSDWGGGTPGVPHLAVQFRRSTDGGASWSPIETIAASSDADYSWPKIVVGLNETRIVTFSDMANRLMYYTYSTDRGDTWANATQLAGAAINPRGSFYPVFNRAINNSVDYVYVTGVNAPYSIMYDRFTIACPLPTLVLFAPIVNGLQVSVNGYTGSSCAGVIRLSWNWGDGTVHDSWFPASHTYAASGVYTITVTAYDALGQTTTGTISANVAGCATGTHPVDVMLVIDRSGSMSGTPLADEMVAAEGFVDRMNLTQDQVGLASFETSATLNQQLTHSGTVVKAAIHALTVGGTTNMGGGINVAQAELQSARHNPMARPVMLLMSDGMPNIGPDPLAAAQAAKNAGTRIFTIGLGQVDANLLRQLASSPADYYYVPTSADLAAIYQTIAGVVTCAQPKVKISPASKRVSLSGGAFTMDIVAQDVTNLGAYQVQLTYNPAVVHVTAVTAGSFLGSTGRTVSQVGPTIDNAAGRVTVGAFTFGAQPGVNGTGVLATVTFQPQARGTNALHLQNLQMADPNSNPIPGVTTEDGQVEVIGCFGDFDGDNDVDIFDLQRAASKWNCRSGDACYDAQFDTEPDGDVDVFDLQRFAAVWGTVCITAQTLQAPVIAGLPQEATAVGIGLIPASVQVTPGDLFTQTVRIQDAANVGAFQTDLVYDLAVVRVEGVTIGSFLGSTGRTVTPLGPAIDNGKGRVTFGAFTFGNQPGASGAGDLAYVRLLAQAIGQTALDFQQTAISDPEGNPAPIGALNSGIVIVRSQHQVYLPMMSKQH